ncbi:hypothetical protein COU18_03045 [Candidatus Kaiserbacteria bacterium CG10_big_fil_rev_8_21_14_0_10_51_14]|uniref:DUF6745 domain-containing protein n=1 Tax=Candidatus Kaiserbacteria bacterium CG10_big_fil_rev_8_21_14_0_10_51_14 TaxID=1974610 RepID=A0A2H0UB32_9BACT|nr:MAG: hypothetical protein COU18_03045 [Candidatus Kaiserbacteria bacterium CG10_big_fil_rev_8_21_14_0_10_51_14]
MSEEKKLPNRIRTPEDAELWRPIVGEQGYNGLLRALKDGVSFWVFQSVSEVLYDGDLTDDEKVATLKILIKEHEEGRKFCGWMRRPPSTRFRDMLADLGGCPH